MSPPRTFTCKACGVVSPEDEDGSEFGWCFDCYADELCREAVWRGLATYDDEGLLVLKGE